MGRGKKDTRNIRRINTKTNSTQVEKEAKNLSIKTNSEEASISTKIGIGIGPGHRRSKKH
jgi:hypothetical protein